MLLAIAGGNVWPLAGAKPGIEGIFVAAVSLAVFLDFLLVDALIENPVGWVVDVLEGWDRNAPWNLA